MPKTTISIPKSAVRVSEAAVSGRCSLPKDLDGKVVESFTVLIKCACLNGLLSLYVLNLMIVDCWLLPILRAARNWFLPGSGTLSLFLHISPALALVL